MVPIRHHSAEVSFAIKHNPIMTRDIPRIRAILHVYTAVRVDGEDDLRIRRKDGTLGQKAEEAFILFIACDREHIAVTAERVKCRDSPGVGVWFLESGIEALGAVAVWRREDKVWENVAEVFAKHPVSGFGDDFGGVDDVSAGPVALWMEAEFA